MNILVMTSYFPPHFRGGAELRCREHAERLQARGHKVFVLTSQWGIEKRSVEGNIYRLLDYDKTNLGSDCANDFGGPLRLRRRYDQLRRALSLSKNYSLARSVVTIAQPDVAYVWHMEDVSIGPILAAQDSGIPIVIRLPDDWLARLRTELRLEPSPLKRWYRNVFIGLGGFSRLDTTHMLPLSHTLMQSYVQAGFPASHMQVVSNGLSSDLVLDVDELSPLPMSSQSGDVRLLFVGRVVKAKAPDVAIRAIAHLASEPSVRRARLDIIGEGPEGYERELRAMASELGLRNRVSFLGKLDPSRVLECYKQYDALLFPSRWVEPLGGVVMEAMARGLPVVATNHGGQREVIANGESGLLVPPDDPAAMAEAVKQLLVNPGLAQSIRVKALATIRDHHSLERIVDQVERCLLAAGSHRDETEGHTPAIETSFSTPRMPT